MYSIVFIIVYLYTNLFAYWHIRVLGAFGNVYIIVYLYSILNTTLDSLTEYFILGNLLIHGGIVAMIF